jgi:hypothetical protein
MSREGARGFLKKMILVVPADTVCSNAARNFSA